MREIGSLVGSGRVADVHEYGEHAIKLYHPGRGKAEAFLEASVLSILEHHDLPVPRVHEAGEYGGRWGLVIDRIDGDTLGQRAMSDAAEAPAVLEEMVRLQLRLHGIAETRLRPLKARLATKIESAPGLDDSTRRRIQAALAELPDGDRICHGDFHPLNIIGEPGRTTIIDWLDVTSGAPAADACRSYLLLKFGATPFAGPYLDRYSAQSGIERSAILAWLPCLAAARLAEGVENEEQELLDLARSA